MYVLLYTQGGGATDIFYDTWTHMVDGWEAQIVKSLQLTDTQQHTEKVLSDLEGMSKSIVFLW